LWLGFRWRLGRWGWWRWGRGRRWGWWRWRRWWRWWRWRLRDAFHLELGELRRDAELLDGSENDRAALRLIGQHRFQRGHGHRRSVVASDGRDRVRIGRTHDPFGVLPGGEARRCGGDEDERAGGDRR
jgi:hypothetical protein